MTTITAHDGTEIMLTTDLPADNIWIEVKRADGVGVYVGSLFFTENPDGSLTVEWGTNRNEDETWETTQAVTIPAHQLEGDGA
jgi:hypothetical protein